MGVTVLQKKKRSRSIDAHDHPQASRDSTGLGRSAAKTCVPIATVGQNDA
jgi:hypothetical protein